MKLPEEVTDDKVFAELETICSSGNVPAILKRLEVNDSIDLCAEQNLAAPGIYPFLFNKRFSGKLKQRISAKNPFVKLNAYLRNRTQIILPKHIIIHDNVLGRSLYFGPTDTKPTRKGLLDNNLSCLELHNMFVISKALSDVNFNIPVVEPSSPEQVQFSHMNQALQGQDTPLTTENYLSVPGALDASGIEVPDTAVPGEHNASVLDQDMGDLNITLLARHETSPILDTDELNDYVLEISVSLQEAQDASCINTTEQNPDNNSNNEHNDEGPLSAANSSSIRGQSF